MDRSRNCNEVLPVYMYLKTCKYGYVYFSFFSFLFFSLFLEWGGGGVERVTYLFSRPLCASHLCYVPFMSQRKRQPASATLPRLLLCKPNTRHGSHRVALLLLSAD